MRLSRWLEVVEFILDLVGYSIDTPLHRQRLLEPSFGAGDFLLPIIDRLLSSWRRGLGHLSSAVGELGDAIRAVELHRETFEATRNAVTNRLKREGLSATLFRETSFLNHWTPGSTMLSATLLMFGRSLSRHHYSPNTDGATKRCMIARISISRS